MELTYSPAEQAFRTEVRDWIRENLPPALAAKVRGGKRLSKADYELWHARLQTRNWLAWHWPVEHGGPGWTPVQKHIFDEEMIAAGAPRIIPFGVNMLGPVLIEFGTEAQKARWLPRILDGSDWWCQGYSEPGAGSDLASLRTRAVRQGDHYVVNGQKTWTTLGHHANMMFCLARTDPDAKPQEGISFLLIDMASPGIEVRPIVTLDGEHEVNEVWLTDVKVPAKNLVGEENRGWTCAKYLLGFERTGIAGVAFSKAALSHLKRVARERRKDGRPLAENPFFAARMARLEIDLMAMDIFNLRMIAAAAQGKSPGPEASLLKIKGTEVRQEASDLIRRALGPYAMPFLPEALDEGWNGEPVGPDYANTAATQYFNLRKTSIYGGSNEIQKNIYAKLALDL
ncbi:acyl-CoA dehydrogenase family protein [Limibaculum sp. M0105]|uniref:Acyl-CoA dehydrogenase family protein n=1 Tax=Thermohalobaculum xanthum TaxID=2753746 RepID=A0A8J7SDT4_9RHOB|nr:acyl-CoA dehydrogenase family protein [Thermohalobaculum xanthum]MBK0400262.1 acyl-CoA dehydrogenase family protein [Thermohalobaculum xanthum]